MDASTCDKGFDYLTRIVHDPREIDAPTWNALLHAQPGGRWLRPVHAP
jgi:hypothetical protein